MLEEATTALSRLDSAALEALERRATALRDSLAGGTLRGAGVACGTQLRAGLGMFADVVTATSRDLAILRRTSAAGQGQYKAEGGLRWAR